MKKVLLLLSFFCTIIPFAHAQTPDFSAIDSYAKKIPENQTNDLDKLYSYLVKPCKTDLDKVRSFYVWLSYNIRYDMVNYLADKYPPYDPPTILKTKLAVCQGFANVLDALCKKANIPSQVVDGYSKSMGYVQGQKFKNPDHAWNSIKINNKWYLFDVTWDCIGTNMPKQFPDKPFSSSFFMVPPDEFWVNHLPSDPAWQLSSAVLSLAEFEKGKEDAVKLTSSSKSIFSFNDSLLLYKKSDTTDALVQYSRRAAIFNPLNTEARILLALGYFYKGEQVLAELKNVSLKEYDLKHKEFESRVNNYYQSAYKTLKEVKPGMKFYKEAQESIKIIESFKIDTETTKPTTTAKNYKLNKTFKPTVLNSNVKYEITKLDVVNSSSKETNLSITPDGKLLFFMSDRGGQPWSVKSYYRKNGYDGDLWFSRKLNGKFQSPACLDKSLNTSSGEDEPNISPDGKKIVYQSWMDKWKSNGGPYYIADLNGTRCSDIRGLGDGISRFFVHSSNVNKGSFATDGATMSPDGNRFIVACGSDYNGNMDLYISEKDAHGKWNLMKPLPINTKLDERSVFLAADGKTLFFASSGYNGFGGLDIYKTVIDENGQIGELINLGSNFNTPQDDYGFILNATGTEAFFVRDGDIFQVTFTEPIKEILPGKSLVITGTIATDSTDYKNLTLSITDSIGKVEFATSGCSDSGTYYLFIKNPQPGIKLKVIQNKTVVKEIPVNINNNDNYSEVQTNINLIKPQPEKAENDTVVNIIRLRDEKYESGMFARVNFEYDNFDVQEKYFEQLNQLVQFLQTHPKHKLGIAGYSDIRGSNDYNLKLSQRRANSVYNYLLKHGVNKNQLILNFYGAENPLTLDNTIAGGWTNRRVEFMLVSDFPVRRKIK